MSLAVVYRTNCLILKRFQEFDESDSLVSSSDARHRENFHESSGLRNVIVIAQQRSLQRAARSINLEKRK